METVREELSNESYDLLRHGYVIDVWREDAPALQVRLLGDDWSVMRQHLAIRELFDCGLSDRYGKLTEAGFKVLCKLKS